MAATTASAAEIAYIKGLSGNAQILPQDTLEGETTQLQCPYSSRYALRSKAVPLRRQQPEKDRSNKSAADAFRSACTTAISAPATNIGSNDGKLAARRPRPTGTQPNGSMAAPVG